ncbi:MAG: AtpZ/AtpI family protein [Bdellovibrionales bacterium]|nr:AtpZ/AtpI family protein [Bdellovibrionales bacterium]
MNSKGIVFLGIGFELVALCAGGYFIGDFLDKHYGWNGTGATYLTLVLMISWFMHLIYLLRKFEREENSDDSSPGPQP